jgi:transposase InsO family protein
MWSANPTWGSPRIVLELKKLGIDIAKSTVEQYQLKYDRPTSPGWKTFLELHAHDFAAMDFFVVPTAGLKVLFVLVILGHERRRVLHFNITEHPTAEWTAQQLVEAFPFDTAPRYLLRDGDAIYGEKVRRKSRALGIVEVVTAPASPWQNAYAERLIGSIRREILDHVVVLNEGHLRRLLETYSASTTNGARIGRLMETRRIYGPFAELGQKKLPNSRRFTGFITITCPRLREFSGHTVGKTSMCGKSGRPWGRGAEQATETAVELVKQSQMRGWTATN